MEKAESYAIVGGGMLGLTLALRLRESGHEVSVFEAAPDFGGLAGAWSLGDVTWDRHYHVTLLSDGNLRALLRDMTLDDEIKWAITKTGCFGDGRLMSLSNTLEFLRFPLLGMVDKARLALTILRAAQIRNWRALEKITVERWLRRWSGKRTYERFWLPLLLSKLGKAHEHTSAAFIWATIQRLYAARRSGLKEEKFGYVKGGYARVVGRMTERLRHQGVTLVAGARIHSIHPAAQNLEITREDGAVERFDRVIVTTTPDIASALCPTLSEEERNRLESVDYLGIVCASLLLTRPLGGYYVTNLVDNGFPFTGIIEMTALVSPDELNGHRLVYLPRYLAPDDSFASKSDDDIRDVFLAGLRRVFPDLRDEEVLAFRISRVRNVMPIPTVDYSQKVSSFTTSVPGLFLVNSSQIVNGTLNVNETVGLANRAYSEITAP